MRVALLNEIHRRKIGFGKDLRVPEGIVIVPFLDISGSTHHGLEHELTRNLFYKLVQSIKRISQVVEHAHE